jgi:UDPglucose--hexose-1-phosphate uridylyltransferase
MRNELRKDYFLDRWVIISAGRGKRPSDFKQHAPIEGKEGLCFFCPGNENTTPPEISRVEEDGEWIIRVFPNKFPAVTLEEGEIKENLMPARGLHEIVVETPEHGKSIADLSVERMVGVLEVCAGRVEAMLAREGVEYALVFKNHGSAAGASLAHTHTQIISLPFPPKLVAEEAKSSEEYEDEHGSCPICDAVKRESGGPRSIYEDDFVSVFTPYASRSPFEVWVVPKRHLTQLSDFTMDEKTSVAGALISVLSRLRDGLNDPPYNYYIHASPVGGNLHLHIEILPKLSIWAGFELGGEIIINTMPPETAAEFYSTG